jgi:hypothetical protein
VVQLREGSAGVGEHVGHVVVDRLDVREQVAVAEVAQERQRLRDPLVERGQLEAE